MTMTTRSQPEGEVAAALRDWWQKLEEARGDRAALRRCGSLTEVVFIPAYHRLYAAVAPHGWTDRLGVAAIAGLASLVRADVPDVSLARQMAQVKPGGSSARISGLRFRRLLKQQTREDLFPALGRIVRALDGRVNLAGLAEAAYWWNDRTRQNWAFDYYDAAPHEQ
jgi:CRISPR system Cascade subunit CasB